MIVDAENGYLLTNNHVIDGADDIQVTTHDGRTLMAEIIGTDPDTDVALIQVHAEGLSALKLAESERLRVGDFVVAVGNPFGLGQTVTSGIVSALGRRGLRGLNYQNFIQTDASINPGNSGGALINLRGELVGINTAIFSPSGGNVGIGFAIPARIARDVMEELLEYGAVRRGQLGVALQSLDASLAEALELERVSGALVTRVRPGSDAAEAGIQAGDVILEIAGEPVSDPASLRNSEGLLPVGEPVPLKLFRDGRALDLELSLSPGLPRELDGAALHASLAGTRLGSIEDHARREVAIEGVLVLAVREGSPAWALGLRQGDALLAVNRQPVPDLETLAAELERGGATPLVKVLRGRRSYLLPLG